MKIYTGNFGKLRKLDDSIVPIDITLLPPHFAQLHRYTALAPKATTLFNYKSGKSGELEYIADYQKILDKLKPKKVIEELKKLSGGKDIVLTCYCGTDKFCHRFIVSEFLSDSLNIDIEELGTGTTTCKQGKLTGL